VVQIITASTTDREQIVDITADVGKRVAESQVLFGLVSVYVRGATAGIMIQENWDESVQSDILHLLRQLIPQGVWKHDAQDNNGDAHLKAGLVGPSETIPIIDGKMGLSTWQNIFLCEFDGPRRDRQIVLTILESSGVSG